jgi:cell division septum initiation protein DivIVA
MAHDDTEFSTELRGYKKNDVDAAIAALRGDLIQAAKYRQGALDEIAALKEQLAAFDGGEVVPATYAALGARLESILRIAEEQSAALVGQADIDAERTIALAKFEASTLVETATKDADRLATDSRNESDSLLESAKAQAAMILPYAKEEAQRLKSEAIDEAGAIRGAVATESAKTRTSAQRESEALRAEANRSIAESVVVAEREMNKTRAQIGELEKKIASESASHDLTLQEMAQEGEQAETEFHKEMAQTAARLKIENERLSELLAHQASEARADLEAELSARRADAEKELLDAHQRAVEMNDQYLEKSTTQLAETKARLAVLRADHRRILAAIEESNLSGKLDATRHAKKTVVDAEKQALDIIRMADVEATQTVAGAEQRLVELAAERDTIAQYVQSLRTIVGKVVNTESTLDSPTAKRRSSRAKEK